VTACPNCGSTGEPLPVLFGYPTPEGFEAAARGEIELGGCIPAEFEFVCRSCREPVAVDPRERRPGRQEGAPM
jgi:hypothetical protein